MSTKQLDKPRKSKQAPETPPNEAAAARDSVSPTDAGSTFLVPPVTIYETSEAITILADLPGVCKERVQLSFEQDTLTLEGQLALELDGASSTKAVQADVRTPRFRRSFIIGSELDTASIKAEMKDGVLEIRIPKLASARPFKIAIN